MPDKVDIESVLSKLAADADRIVGNPADVEELRRQGVAIEALPKRSLDASIDIIFTKRKEGALERAKLLPPFPTMPYAAAALYEEIYTCIVMGLYGSAITLSGVLVEFVLKLATYVKEAGGYANYNPDHWDQFEQIAFGAAINRAKKAGLINPTQVKDLIRFKNNIRNPYNHYNIRKITLAVVWNKVQVVDLKTGAVEERSIAAKDDPVIQAQAKPIVDAKQVLRVFGFADAVVRALLTQVEMTEEHGKGPE